MASASAAAALVDFGDVDGSLPAAAALPLPTPVVSSPSSLPLPTALPSRHRKRRSKRTQAPVTAPNPAAAGGTAAAGAAPWEVNEEAEAAEKKEELREALRKKLKQQKLARSNRTAFEARQERSGESGNGTGEGGGGAATAGGLGVPDLSNVMGNVDSAMLQALAAKMGVSPDQMPNRRKIERMLKGMSMSEMMARAGSRAGK